jgi:hypothetical protein
MSYVDKAPAGVAMETSIFHQRTYDRTMHACLSLPGRYGPDNGAELAVIRHRCVEASSPILLVVGESHKANNSAMLRFSNSCLPSAQSIN